LAASFAQLIKSFCRNSQPDLLFIEPSGMVTTRELAAAATIGLRDCAYDIGPFITLVDGPDFEFVWAERRNLVVAQIAGADLVAVSRVDMQEDEKLAEIKQCLKPHARNLVELSPMKGRGLESVMKLLDPDLSAKP
jgi:G3E family GTPase